jgi:hypothetical protein
MNEVFMELNDLDGMLTSTEWSDIYIQNTSNELLRVSDVSDELEDLILLITK